MLSRDAIGSTLSLLVSAHVHEHDTEKREALTLAVDLIVDLIRLVEHVSYGERDCPADLSDRLAQARAVIFADEDTTPDA